MFPRVSDGWIPPLRLHEGSDGLRLTLGGIASGHGETMQDAADDLVQRLLSVVHGMRSGGTRFSRSLGPPDRRALAFLHELGDIAAAGGDIRERLFSPTVGGG
jgi:hypothetical protein